MRNRLQTTNIFMVIMLGAYFMASSVVSGVILLYPDLPYMDTWMNTTIYLLGFGLPCILYAVFLWQRVDQPLSTTFSFRKLPLSSLLLCVLLGFLIQPVSALLAQASSMVFSDITSTAIEGMTTSPLPLMIFAMAILPALFEELLCRGILYDGYKEAPLWYQLVLPGVFFGMLHMNFQQISYALPMGIFLALVLYITRSIYSTMTIHFIMNGTQVTLSWLSENLGWFDRGKKFEDILVTILCGHYNIAITAMIAAGAILIIVGVLTLLSKIHAKDAPGKRSVLPGWHKGGWILYLTLAFLFLGALMIELAMPLLGEFM